VPAAELVAELVRDLGLPGRLRDADVPHDRLDEIADVAMHDRWIPTNPRPLDRDGVRKLLEAAW
jgi:maleylacetate reductase